MMKKYVCAFRGRRDNYQVPLALAETGRLEEFITDAYATPLIRKVATIFANSTGNAQLVRFRYTEGIPDHLVRCVWGTTAIEHLRHWIRIPPNVTYGKLDQVYSRTAARSARRARSDLLLYTPYAWEAFTARYHHQPRRVLFQYHPHLAFERRLLKSDVAIFPEIAHSFAQEAGVKLPESLRRRVECCWRYADRIICASSFTRRTLLEAGADSKICTVVPYGVHTQVTNGSEYKPPEGFHALFVGSGIQRKGLHHLLVAWNRANLPAKSTLTLVCRVLDPGLKDRIARTPGVRCLPGVGKQQLDLLYRRSSLLTMPSLTEGFGQVYLEALANGCPVLGTTHTCLPDIGNEADGVFLAAVGDLEHLTHRLEYLANKLPNEPKLRLSAQARARYFTWPKFRAKVNALL